MEKQPERPLQGGGRIRLGLCCIFRKAPIRFRAVTAKHLRRFGRAEQLARLSAICLDNSESLLAALHFIASRDIGAFRILSPFFPRFTHPEVGYALEDLPHAKTILDNLQRAEKFRQRKGLRLSFHPDQFIFLSSPQASVTENSIMELEYQAMVAEILGADVINIHGGGAYGDKGASLKRLRRNFQRLSGKLRRKLTLENDDRSYTVADLVPVCRELQVPLVYDVHHHRCNPDGLTEEEATELSLETWEMVGREPYFHISSPLNGWQGKDPRPHADYIDPADLPRCWRNLNVTVDVEAKAKELAVLALQKFLEAEKSASAQRG